MVNLEVCRRISDLLRRTMYRKALKVADEAIAGDRNDSVVHGLRSQALLGLRRYGEAIKAAETAIAIDPRFSRHYTALAAIHLDRNCFAEAREVANQSLALAESSIAYRIIANSWLAEGNPDEALAAIDQCRAKCTEDSRNDALRNEILNELGKNQ